MYNRPWQNLEENVLLQETTSGSLFTDLNPPEHLQDELEH